MGEGLWWHVLVSKVELDTAADAFSLDSREELGVCGLSRGSLDAGLASGALVIACGLSITTGCLSRQSSYMLELLVQREEMSYTHWGMEGRTIRKNWKVIQIELPNSKHFNSFITGVRPPSRATQQVVSSWQVSKASSVFAAIPHCSRDHLSSTSCHISGIRFS